MKGLFYRLLSWLGRHVGVWFVAAFAWLVSTGYFLFRPGRVATSVRFYRALHPERGAGHALRCTWRQFHHFAGVYAERLRLASTRDQRLSDSSQLTAHSSQLTAPSSQPPQRPGFSCTEEGLDHLARAAEARTGAILVMSHVGSWEIGARLLQRRGFPLQLHMGIKAREQIERLQKSDLQQDGVEVLAAASAEASPFDLVEGLRFLRAGGFVSLAADRPRGEPGRTVAVRFLGHEVRLSAAPWVLALLSRAPVFHFFALRTGRGRYLFVASTPRVVRVERRADRDEAIRRAAQDYADDLADIVRRHPEQWYSFEPFLGPSMASG